MQCVIPTHQQQVEVRAENSDDSSNEVGAVGQEDRGLAAEAGDNTCAATCNPLVSGETPEEASKYVSSPEYSVQHSRSVVLLAHPVSLPEREGHSEVNVQYFHLT
jgi:hypothetical protein